MVDRMVCSAVQHETRVAPADLDDDHLLAESHSIEMSRRAAEADQIRLLAEIERRALQTVDGHRGIDGWGRGVHRWTTPESKARKALVRLGRAAPVVLERLHDGSLGVAQAHVLAITFVHPRVGPLLLGKLDAFLETAASVSFPKFEQEVTNWRLLADQDGPDPERAMRDRAAGLARGDHGFQLRANGPATDGVELDAILQYYERAEWERDWAWTRAEHGERACEALMPRTKQQRRYDALVAIFEDAVSTPAGATPNEPLVNLMIDPHTLADTLAKLFGDCECAKERRAEVVPDPLRRFSQTTAGRHVPPVDVVLAALRGQIRRVITDHRGIVLDMGRRRRLFTGANRQAVLLAATHCTHPGCLVEASRSQADHLTPFSHGGHTTTREAGPGCGHHNRYRYVSGATTTLDDKGRWKTRRADGTDIAPPDHPHPQAG
jgi:hypothetical protein